MMKENDYIVEINAEYNEALYSRLLMISTTDDKKTVGENVARTKVVLNKSFCQRFDSYEAYLEKNSKYDSITKEEFETMKDCFDGYNEYTFESYLKARYGYKTKLLPTRRDFEVSI